MKLAKSLCNDRAFGARQLSRLRRSLFALYPSPLQVAYSVPQRRRVAMLSGVAMTSLYCAVTRYTS